MSVLFQNKQLRLNTGECIGVEPHHVNKTGSWEVWRWHDMCITRDENRAVICSYDGNFIESQKSNCTEGGLALDLSFWSYKKDNTVNLVRHQSDGCRQGGGGRDFQIDPTSGKIFFKPLVLGKRHDGTIELVPKDDTRALRVKNLPSCGGNIYDPQFLQLADGTLIGRKWNDKKTAGEWQYIDLCGTDDYNKALKCTYDGQFISANYQGEMTFDLSMWTYKQGNHFVCVNGPNKERTRLEGGGRDFCFYSDGQIGMKPLALGRRKGTDKLVTVDPSSPNAIQLDLNYLMSGNIIGLLTPAPTSAPMSTNNTPVLFQNKQLRLTTGECLGVLPHHVNKTGSWQVWRWHDMCITRDVNRAIICSYDGNFIESQKSSCTEGGLALDLSHWNYKVDNTVNLVKHHSDGCRHGGGGRDFQIDPVSGKILFKPLVLGKRHDGTIELVPKDDMRALRVTNLVNCGGNIYDPQFLQLADGAFIGRKWDGKKTFHEWKYIDLCVTNDQSKALRCTYDGQFISTDYQGEMTFDLSMWTYKQGNHFVCVNGPSTQKTRLVGGGRDFCFYPDGQVGMKPFALGRRTAGDRLVTVDPNSPNVIQLNLNYLKSGNFIENTPVPTLAPTPKPKPVITYNTSVLFKNKQLRLTNGECIGVEPHHVNKTGSHDVWRWHDMCITRDVNRAIICSYDGNFIESQKSNCTEGGLALDLSHWSYNVNNTVNLVKHHSDGCRHGGGGRDFQIDPTSGKILFKPLVLGKRHDGTIELVPKDDSRALRVTNLVNCGGNIYDPQFLQLADGGFIGRKWDDKRTAGEWKYIDLCVTNDQYKALRCTYDGQFIFADYQGEMTLDLAMWSYKQGNHFVCVNGPNQQRTRLEGGGRDFCFYPDGQVGMKPFALGRRKDGDRLVTVDPNSPNAIQLDLDYLMSEKFIEIKNRRIYELEKENDRLKPENDRLKADNDRLKAENDRLFQKLQDYVRENKQDSEEAPREEIVDEESFLPPPPSYPNEQEKQAGELIQNVMESAKEEQEAQEEDQEAQEEDQEAQGEARQEQAGELVQNVMNITIENNNNNSNYAETQAEKEEMKRIREAQQAEEEYQAEKQAEELTEALE